MADRQARTVWLVGMMGAGKSTIGPKLARRLGRRFIDTDAEVERVAGRRVSEIFEREGEPAFRARERAAIEACCGQPAVVALGGGAIEPPGARQRLASTGTLIYLRARPATLLARLGDARGRPLLAGLTPDGQAGRLAQLLERRRAAYESASIVIDTDDLAPDSVVEALAERLEQVRAQRAVGERRREARGRPRAGTRRRGGEMSSAARLRTVEVFLGERSYPIHLGAGTLAAAGDAIARHTKATHAAVVTVPGVGRRYAGRLLRSLRQAGLRTTRIDVPDGDAAKTLRQAERLYQRLLASQADRSSVVVALGGGAVGDLAGFAAATYLRGVSFVQVPTTVLAMVDASIGGKVAVNLPQGKNLVGAFYQPKLVWIDVATLASLPVRARAAGLAEVVKAAAIRDAGFFADLERDAERLLALDEAALLPALERACAIKAKVVSEDEREQGLRMLLNFGHTLAHAVEALMGYRRILHGEAVSMGMAFAARRSEQLGTAPAGTAARLCALLERLGLPTELPARPRSAYLRALKVDKKRRDARIHYIVLRGIGRAESVPLTAAEILPGPAGPKRR